jgi:hypothetical protein
MPKPSFDQSTGSGGFAQKQMHAPPGGARAGSSMAESRPFGRRSAVLNKGSGELPLGRFAIVTAAGIGLAAALLAAAVLLSRPTTSGLIWTSQQGG